MPAITAVTTPSDAPTVATDVFELLHVPPIVASLSVEVRLTQIFGLPVIAAGEEFIVTTVVARQPVDIV